MRLHCAPFMACPPATVLVTEIHAGNMALCDYRSQTLPPNADWLSVFPSITPVFSLLACLRDTEAAD